MDLQKSETAYRVLARKYRPQNFADLIGQEPMVRTLTNAFDMGRIAQAWMLTGVRGVGKTTTARILARALNYKTAAADRPTAHLTEMGEHCQSIMEGRHVDVVEMDAASHTGIDDIREIIEQIRYRPVSARYKVYIIDEVHMLSTQAFNGLLKTLEEPPPHVKFIFATTEIRKVPITVLSRCQRFDLRRVDTALLTRHLQKITQAEGAEAETEALAMIARAGEGSVRDCLSMLDQAIAHSGAGSADGAIKITAPAVASQLGLADKTQIIALFRHLMQGQAAEALGQIQRLYEFGADPSIIIRELLDFNHFITRLKFQPSLAEDISLSEEERKSGREFAEKLSIRVLSRSWQMLLKGLSEAENADRPLAAAEMLLIRLCHAADLPNLDEALHWLEAQRQTGAKPATIDTTLPAPAANETAMPAAAPNTAPALPAIAAKPAEAPAEPQAASPAQPVKKNFDCDSLSALAALAGKRGKLQLQHYLRENIRPVLLQGPKETEHGRQAGLVRFTPIAGAPADIERQIGALLLEETNERWRVEIAESGGGLTIAEEENRQKQRQIDEAKSNADVAAILRSFPQAKLEAVRITPNDTILPEAAKDENGNQTAE